LQRSCLTVLCFRFQDKLELCNKNAGWLLDFVQSREELDESVPKLIDIDYCFRVNLKSTLVQEKIDEKINKMTFTNQDCEKLERLTRGQNKKHAMGRGENGQGDRIELWGCDKFKT